MNIGTTTAGQAAEMLAMMECTHRGYTVSIPFGNKAPYDFVVDTGTKLYRIQVREIHYAMVASGRRWMLDFMKPRGAGKYLRYEKYTQDDIDFLIGVCVKHSTFYIFPVEAVCNRRQASFYFDSTPPQMARNYDWTEQYKNEWF